MLLIGMLIREKKIMTDSGIASLQSLVMNVTLPAGLFGAFYKTKLSTGDMILPLTLFLLVVGGIFVGKLFGKAFKEKDEYLPFILCGYEFGMLGYALISILAGQNSITAFAMMDIGQSLAIFTVYVAMLKNLGGKKQSASDVISGLLTTPVLVAIVTGSIIGITGLGSVLQSIGAGDVIDTLCSFISAPTSAVILIVIGYRMKFRGLKWNNVLKVCAMRILMQAVFAAVVFAVFNAIGGLCVNRVVTQSMILALILPPPYILPLYIDSDVKKEFYSSTLSVYTLFSIVGFIALVAIYT